MAWLKDIENASGVIVGYHEIEKAFSHDGVVEISYKGWITKQAKADGKEPVVNKSKSILISAIQSDYNAYEAALEQQILADQEFNGATPTDKAEAPAMIEAEPAEEIKA